MKKRKKVLVHSNSHFAFTGFGKNCKNVLKYLYSTNKYELHELANGVVTTDTKESFPWEVHGGVPNDQGILERAKTDPLVGRGVGYGLFTVDKIIKDLKPDVYIGIEDIWAFTETVKKPWWNKINCMIWTTLDSLPILPDAVNLASKIKNYYVWSSFAEKAMRQMGLNHIKTLHGSVDETNFYKLPEEKRSELRTKFGIPKDCFVTGFVFRNQLRKTVGDLITGFKIFKNEFPETDAKLLLHTNFSEGWDIPRLIQENGLKPQDILTTYHCSNCKNYYVSPFQGQGVDCPFCKKEKSFSTTSVTNGISEFQLNEIYNLMDCYIHPFTSGGQEIPIQEAKLTELVTAVTNYTCGEDMCTPESGGFALAWSPYREIGTQFVKASTSPVDIANKMKEIFKMPKETKDELGRKARQYILDNYSFNAVGKKLEKIIDEMPDVDYDFSKLEAKPNPSYEVKQKYSSDIDFVKDIYKNILSLEIDKDDEGLKYWVSELRKGLNPAQVVNHFRSVAQKELSEKFPVKVEDLIDESEKKRIAIVIPTDSFVALIYSYFIDSVLSDYPSYQVYVFADKSVHPFFYSFLDRIKLRQKTQDCENQVFMEGIGNHKGFFDMCLSPDTKLLNSAIYSHNAIDI